MYGDLDLVFPTLSGVTPTFNRDYTPKIISSRPEPINRMVLHKGFHKIKN